MQTRLPKAIFIRHPESTGNASDLVKGTGDYPLDAQGERESAQLSTRIARAKPTVVISSPLQRAIEPAAAIARKAGVALKIDSDLLPQDFGELTGTPRKTGEPQIKKATLGTPDEPIPGGESFNDWDAKQQRAVRRVKLMMAAGERPAVVTHSRNLRQLSHSLFGDAVADPTSGGPDPSGYTTLEGKRKLVLHKGAAR